jgi:hypothetical protein
MCRHGENGEAHGQKDSLKSVHALIVAPAEA